MLEMISDLPDHVLGVTAHGAVTAEDYRKVLVPAIEALLAKQHRVRLLYVLAKDFAGYSAGAAWEDAKVGLQHLTMFQRVAWVTDDEKMRTLVQAFGFAIPCEVRIYRLGELAVAREWVCEPVAPGKLQFRLDRETGVLLVEPHGELEAADFDRLRAEVDPHLEQEGKLEGVVVIAEHFPGWDDLSAFGSHLRFVREHHRKVRRVALVTNDWLAWAVPRFARLFTNAEVRTFALEQRDQANRWVAER
ncbi:MAG TPA: STAS/SEC14 domain-containing protein [Polyangiaceae bacterium]|nr:STAS/SEC14 domain-containing protein [Polyangiaceae bacterium]